MGDYDDVCTNSYICECFDDKDARPDGRKRGSMHGEVKIYTKKEIERFELDRADGLI